MAHFFILIIFLLLSLFGFNSAIFAQNAGEKTQALISALDKTKHKKKEKKNFLTETFVDVRNAAVLKNNVREYAGVYEFSAGDYRIELRVAADGRVEGAGHDANFSGSSSSRQPFILRDARIDGALLTATKVFADGSSDRLEAVFANRTVSSGKNPNQIQSRETRYGLGFIDSSGELTNRVFMEFRP